MFQIKWNWSSVKNLQDFTFLNEQMYFFLNEQMYFLDKGKVIMHTVG